MAGGRYKEGAWRVLAKVLVSSALVASSQARAGHRLSVCYQTSERGGRLGMRMRWNYEELQIRQKDGFQW